jgi:hypothetical protein
MKYIVFDYIGSGRLYLADVNDALEMQRIREYQKDYPGNIRQIGVLETDVQLASPWWNIGRKPASRLAWIKSRNADNL